MTSTASNISTMQIETSRFGVLETPTTDLVEINGGILGFPDASRFVRVPVTDSEGWMWLQSTADPELAFLTIEALRFYLDYDVDLGDSDCASIGLEDPADAEILAIVTVRRDAGGVVDAITANLLGPVVINRRLAIGRQVVLADSNYSTREPVTG
jgi:flagellar assembly factor FliW